MEDSKEGAAVQVAQIPRLTSDKVFSALGTSAAGLSAQEAEARQRRYGKNVIQSGKKKSRVLVFLSNFTHMMAILLWVAGVIAFAAGMPELGVAVWLVNVINGCFSYWQESKADKATEALKKMLPSYVNVIRDGQEQKIPSDQLVLDDIVLFKAGDQIPADAELISGKVSVNESLLTGESDEIIKESGAELMSGSFIVGR